MLRFSLRLCLHRSVNISVRFSGQGRDTDRDCCQYKYTDKCSQNHLAVEIFYPGYGRQEGKSTQAGNAEVGRDGTGFPGCINLLLIRIIAIITPAAGAATKEEMASTADLPGTL